MGRSTAQPERGFRALNHTADKSIEVWGPTLEELFRAAAEGLFSESTDPAQISADQEWAIDVQASSLDELLRAWLSELIWLSERDHAVPVHYEIFGVDKIEEGPWRVRGRAWVGPAPKAAPHTGAPVKAVTYHDLRLEKDGVSVDELAAVFE